MVSSLSTLSPSKISICSGTFFFVSEVGGDDATRSEGIIKVEGVLSCIISWKLKGRRDLKGRSVGLISNTAGKLDCLNTKQRLSSTIPSCLVTTLDITLIA